MSRALRRAIVGLFGATLFASAALLFCVEPMVAKLLMPLLGGAPAVWITCMLFFQAALLAGYAYAHGTLAWLGPRRQSMLHLAVLALPLLVLPIHVRASSVALLGHDAQPVLPLLGVLVGVVGLPFFVVGATAPLLQAWFSSVDDEQGKDPYFLYGASNLGSLLALASYPLLLEPWVGLHAQTLLWTRGYDVLALLVGAAALLTFLRGRDPARVALVATEASIPWERRARWVGLAFVPSSLLLGVTSYITTDVAPIPLFWVVPLGLYLLTFVLVFARRPLLPEALLARVLPFGVSGTVLFLIMQATTPLPLILGVHLATFFVAAMVCHGALAKDRPGSARLTEFYLWVSVGGVLGGVANALVAPVLFTGLAEYPLALVLAAACRPAAPGSKPASLRADLLFAAAIALLTLLLVEAARRLRIDPSGHLVGLVFALPLFATYSQLHRPRRYALGVAATLIGAMRYDASVGETLHAERTFYGVAKVTRDAAGEFTQLAHGNTIHGRQWRDPARRDEPTAYYTRSGPLGQVMGELHAREEREKKPGAVAVVGLGAGTMAPYARPSEAWTYYELNPSVVRMATDPRYFTFLRDAFHGSPRLTIVLGDARLRLEEAPDGAYELLAIDAFSSDAIPAHLLTREAIALYEKKLTRTGLLALHVSNRYLDLVPPLEDLATDAGLVGYVRRDDDGGDPALKDAWTASVWTVLTRPDAPATVLEGDRRWERFAPGHGAVWTDDFTDLVRAFRR